MPDWLSVLLGIGAGIAVVVVALFWAFRPRRIGRRAKLPPRSDAEDPMTAANLDTW